MYWIVGILSILNVVWLPQKGLKFRWNRKVSGTDQNTYDVCTSCIEWRSIEFRIRQRVVYFWNGEETETGAICKSERREHFDNWIAFGSKPDLVADPLIQTEVSYGECTAVKIWIANWWAPTENVYRSIRVLLYQFILRWKGCLNLKVYSKMR